MKKHSSGQILLITLLVLTVIMTIGIAVIGRSRTNVTISNEIEESAKAFSAAEAGIERALLNRQSTTGVQTLTGGTSSFSTNVSAVGASTGHFMFPQKTEQGQSEVLWLVNHNANGTLNETVTYNNDRLDVCWKNIGATAAISLSLLYKRGNTYNVARAMIDPDSDRAAVNNFQTAGAQTTGCGQTGVYKKTIAFSTFTPEPSPTPIPTPTPTSSQVCYDGLGQIVACPNNDNPTSTPIRTPTPANTLAPSSTPTRTPTPSPSRTPTPNATPTPAPICQFSWFTYQPYMKNDCPIGSVCMVMTADGNNVTCEEYELNGDVMAFPAIDVNTDVLIALRIRPLYADAQLFVDSGATTLPSQGDLITSSGTTGTGLTRKIMVLRQFGFAPGIFDSVVLSQTNFVH